MTRTSDSASPRTRSTRTDAARVATSIARHKLCSAIDAGSVTIVDAHPPAQFAKRHLSGLNVVTEDTDARLRAALADETAPIVTHSTEHPCTRRLELAARVRELGYTDVRTYPGRRRGLHRRRTSCRTRTARAVQGEVMGDRLVHRTLRSMSLAGAVGVPRRMRRESARRWEIKP